MLGLGRASEYAGWWSGGAPQMTSSTTASVSAIMSYPSTVSLWSDNGWASPFFNNLTTSFDSSGVVSGLKVCNAKTFRMGSESSYYWLQDPYVTAYDYLAPDNNATSYDPIFFYIGQTGGDVPTGNPKIARRRSDNRVAFLCQWGAYTFVPVTNYTWTDLANRWITVVYSASDSSSEFANFNPIAGYTSGSTYNRLVVADTQTGEILGQVDFRDAPFQTFPNNWASQTITYNSQQSGSEDSWLYSQFRDVTYGDPVLASSGWLSLGETIDPLATSSGAQNYLYFCGNYLPEYINSVRAWVNIRSVSVATVGSNVEMSSMGPGRVSVTGNLYAKQPTSGATSPYVSNIIP